MRQRLRLLRLLRHADPWVVAALVAARGVVELTPMGTALAGGQVVDAIESDTGGAGVGGGLGWAAFALAAVLFAGRAAEALQSYLNTLVTHAINGTLRQRIRTIALEPATLQRVEDAAFRRSAEQATDLGLGNGRARSPGAAAIGQVAFLLRLVGGLGAAGVIAAYFPVLALALLAISLTIRTIVRRHWLHLAEVRHVDGERQRRARYWTQLATESDAAKEVRMFGLSYWLVRRYQRDAIGGVARAWRALFRTLRAQATVMLLAAAGAGAALAVPGFAAMYGAIGARELVTCVLAAWGIFALSYLGPEAFDIEYGGVSVRAYDDVTGRYPRPGSAVTVTEAGPEPTTGQQAPAVRFENVTFTYPQLTAPVLREFHMELAPATVTALVGRNGAGKTTLIKLLCGLYRPTSGRITVDGIDLRDLDQSAWRRRIAVLFQDFIQLPESLYRNIALGAPEAYADREGVRNAAMQAGLSPLIESLPSGLDTSLWTGLSGGVDLSGGQWQRTAIARILFAVAHGRRLVVLDEPTSHLDVATEAAFHERIVAAIPDVTVMLISHRLSTVRPAGVIQLLADGRVVETGEHEALLRRRGEYAALYRLQAAHYRDAGVST